MSRDTFYISTAIPYVNADPHIGHAFELVQTDVIARYQRLSGKDVFFLTGTDENSLKNVIAAESEGIPIQKFVERNAEKFRDLARLLNISHDDFIRTTEERHIQGAQKLWNACKKDDIYTKEYSGLYCVGCEEFYKESDLENGVCPEHKQSPGRVSEENYFFKLSNYQKELYDFIAEGTLRIIPESRRNEMLRFIERGLEDFSISRSEARAKGWGVPVPDDASQRMYVWVDALSNYINALGYMGGSHQYKKYWEEGGTILHCIGKGITRFHAIYWPAILLSAGVRIPDAIFVHGYLTVNGEKMSKSLGNAVSPKEIVEKYGADATRYYLLREISSTEDGDFSTARFEERYNADLANGLGNLIARVLALAENIHMAGNGDFALKVSVDSAWEEYTRALYDFKFNEALEAVWVLIAAANEYINKESPWKLDKENEKRKEVLGGLLTVLMHIGWMLQPLLPNTSSKIFSSLGIDPQSITSWKEQEIKVTRVESLFPRL